MIDPVATIYLSEEASEAVDVFSNTMNSVCYVYEEAIRNVENITSAVLGEELVRSVSSLRCDPSDDVRCHNEWKSTGHDVFGAGKHGGLLQYTKENNNSRSYSHVLWTTIQFSAW